MGDEKGDSDSDDPSIKKGLKMASHSCIVLWMNGTWPLFERRLIFQSDVMFDFCCMTEVKVVMGKEVSV